MTDKHDMEPDDTSDEETPKLRLVPSPPAPQPPADEELRDLIARLQRPLRQRVPPRDEPPAA